MEHQRGEAGIILVKCGRPPRLLSDEAREAGETELI